MKDGLRRLQCKEPNLLQEADQCDPVTLMVDKPVADPLDSLSDAELLKAIETRNLAEMVMSNVLDDDPEKSAGIGAFADKDILKAVKDRGLEEQLLTDVEDDVLVRTAKSRTIRLLYESGPTHLVHELRRRSTHTGYDTYYGSMKLNDLPHASDKVGAVIRKPSIPGKTRDSRNKKRKFNTIDLKDQALFQP